MKRPVILIFVNAIILVMVLALLTQSLFAVQRRAQARAVTGRVEVRRGGAGAFQPLGVGGFVRRGDALRAGENSSAELSWAQSSQWAILPSTELTIAQAAAGSAHRAEHSALELASGKVLVRLDTAPARAQRFEVRTPDAVAQTQGSGTLFSVEARAGQTQVQVWRGAVSLSGVSGQKAVVGAGETGSVRGTGIETGLSARAQANLSRLHPRERLALARH